jgi:hypothetical protein
MIYWRCRLESRDFWHKPVPADEGQLAGKDPLQFRGADSGSRTSDANKHQGVKPANMIINIGLLQNGHNSSIGR